MDLESNSTPLKPPLTDQNVQDAQDLAALGHSQALTRKFDMWSMLALAFCVLGTFLFFRFFSCERHPFATRGFGVNWNPLLTRARRNIFHVCSGSQQWSD
jgi:hypothetical protein